MPRKSTTPAERTRQSLAHARTTLAAATRVAAFLSDPSTAQNVCDCPEGSAAGITERECGCRVSDDARIMEAAGCYIRRSVERGMI